MIRDKTAIVGLGATPYYKRGTSTPQTLEELVGKSILAAVHDAGLKVQDIDGLMSRWLRVEEMAKTNEHSAHRPDANQAPRTRFQREVQAAEQTEDSMEQVSQVVGHQATPNPRPTEVHPKKMEHRQERPNGSQPVDGQGGILGVAPPGKGGAPAGGKGETYPNVDPAWGYWMPQPMWWPQEQQF